MVYSAEEHIAVASSDHPLGPFRQETKRWLREEPAIDGSFFVDDDGSVYLYFVRFRGGNEICAARMKGDLSEIEEEYPDCLISADAAWETIDCSVAEGPCVLKHNGLYYLFYSCNHTRSADYAVGYAVSDDPKGPFKKHADNPILKKNGRFRGVGHNNFVRAADGTLLCVYHCHSIDSENFRPRMVCINTASFVFDESGTDKFVINGPCSFDGE